MKILEDASNETKEAMTDLMDTFGGTDGGGRFVAFCALIVRFDREAREGNQASKQLIKMFHGFARLTTGR
jgi:hypothetical protein